MTQPIHSPDSTRTTQPAMKRFLAFDTSTDVMSVAVTDGVKIWEQTGPGGAKASTTLIATVLQLLADSGLTLDGLDAVVFGQGPGSFTGLRTACAVAQGLAFGARRGAGIPVLPVPTLMALAEEARHQLDPLRLRHSFCLTAMLDARMDEIYIQRYTVRSQQLQPDGPVELVQPEALTPDSIWLCTADVLAGNVFDVYGPRLPSGFAGSRHAALPTAAALLRLAPGLAAQGDCVRADQAAPLYVRNKVAQTTAERALIKASKQPASVAAPLASSVHVP